MVEARSTPRLAGVLAGGLLTVAARLSGHDLRRSVATGATAGAAISSATGAVNRLAREARAAQDAAVLAAMLGQITPFFGRWAVEADFAGAITRELEERRPEFVVECGSGSTTLVIASKLKSNGRGRLLSLEHDPAFAMRTQALIDAAGLNDVVQIVVAPLERQDVMGRSIGWYERSSVAASVDAEVDLLVIDGPPQETALSRWPAVVLLYPLMATDAVVIMDDGRTQSARNTAWASSDTFSDLEVYWIDTLKGAWMLRRQAREQGAAFNALLRLARLINPNPAGFGRWPIRR